MGIGNNLQELGGFLDDCERQGDAIRSVDVTGTSGGGETALRATLDVRTAVDLSKACAEGLCDPRVGPDGTVRFALASSVNLVPTLDHDVAIEPTDATLEGDELRLTVTATVPGDLGDVKDQSGSSPGETASSDALAVTPEPRDQDDYEIEGVRDSDVPPFKDPDLLEEVYETHDTFAEMADTLDMDVTAETVRRYMIDYDIHEPNTYQTGSDTVDAGTDDVQPVVLSDGVGLPEDVTVDAFIETVQRSNTLYEVKQDIDVDRTDALEMLQELNLLDLVMGRLATETERNITREDVVDRLREVEAER